MIFLFLVSLLYFYLLLPLVSFYCSYQMTRQHKAFRWVMPVICGGIAIVLLRIVFHTFEMFFVWMAIVPSVIGGVIGSVVEWKRHRGTAEG